MLFGKTLQGVAKNVWGVLHSARQRQRGQCVPLAQKLANEAGRSQGGEKTRAVINKQTDLAESFFFIYEKSMMKNQ